MYTIEYAVGAGEDLAGLRARDRSSLLDRIEEQFSHEPARETRNRKIVAGLEPPWEHKEPVWELRVGEYRVFYDVDQAEVRVVVRAIRRKPPHKTTKEIL